MAREDSRYSPGPLPALIMVIVLGPIDVVMISNLLVMVQARRGAQVDDA